MVLLCPVCRAPLAQNGGCFQCGNRHSFDIAREGYVNLLRSGKSGSLTGDNKDMAQSRRAFLSGGYYACLADAMRRKLAETCPDGGLAVDICCGEGYYTASAAQSFAGEMLGFDLSKEMIRLAAKRRSRARFFVANMKSLPLADGCADFAMHLFAPFCAGEFARILAPHGRLISVSPGKRHLYALKAVLYDTPYENTETAPAADGLRLIGTERVTDTVTLPTTEEIRLLLQMTPYAYHTPQENLRRLDALTSLTVELDFVLYVYEKAAAEEK